MKQKEVGKKGETFQCLMPKMGVKVPWLIYFYFLEYGLAM
jgi:hypothetical protein